VAARQHWCVKTCLPAITAVVRAAASVDVPEQAMEAAAVVAAVVPAGEASSVVPATDACAGDTSSNTLEMQRRLSIL
jgi:hypothetical protein